MERRGIAQEYYILAVTDIGCMPACTGRRATPLLWLQDLWTSS